MNLDSPTSIIPRVGPEYQKKLKKLGIETIRDLFWHFPHRYEDFSNITPIAEIKIGQNVCIKGKVTEMKLAQTWKRRLIIVNALVQDKTGSIEVVWFNQPYIMNTLKEGDTVFLAGKITKGKKKGIYLSSPTHEKISDLKSSKSDLIHTGRIVPVYHETEGISSKWIRFILKPLMNKLISTVEDPLPKKLRKKNKLLDIQSSLQQIHFPDSMKKAKKAMNRFSFEQLFLLSLAILREKMRLLSKQSVSIPISLKIIQDFVSDLPFTLTNAQKKSVWRILKDLEKPRPMNRLLEGDVGSGKTVVAIMASLNVAKAGYQTAFMAPTEILANQHFEKIVKILKGSKLKIALLTGKESKLNKKKITKKLLLEKISKGKVDIAIGTHALIQKTVKFKNLALVVLDEQHRFGVEQRARLCQNANLNNMVPHLLSMTATPIPRTLALTLYGDLDLSLIDEMPKGRKEIITKIITPKKREEAYKFIAKEMGSKRQAFVICPRIESKSENEETISSWSETRTVKEEYKKLSKEIFPQFKIDILHGKMTSEEKEDKMKKFKDGKTDILVSTSVVEVGIDCPNATVMMIEGAEKFGLAQLHQFRGRVGRGEHQSYCFLLTTSSAQSYNQRLKALTSSQDGFELAEMDLEIRGPGDLSGVRQWGIPDLAMNALKNIKLVEKTREQAKQLLSKDPNLKKEPLLKKALKKYKKRIHLE